MHHPRVLGVASLTLLLSAASAAAQVRYLDEVFDEVKVTRDIQYGAARIEDHHKRPAGVVGEMQPLLLDLYEPLVPEEGSGNYLEEARPVFVWAHGGSGSGGDKGDATERSFCTAFAKRGWVVASVNYRLLADVNYAGISHDYFNAIAPGTVAQLKNAQHDMQAAVRWFRANAEALRIDPEKITVGGHSYGTVLSLYTNFAEADDVGESGNPGFPSHVAAAMAHSGGMVESSSIGLDEPPIVTFNALDDQDFSFFITMANACLPTTAWGNVCDYTIHQSGGHGQGAHRAENIQHTAEFFCEHVLGGCGP